MSQSNHREEITIFAGKTQLVYTRRQKTT